MVSFFTTGKHDRDGIVFYYREIDQAVYDMGIVRDRDLLGQVFRGCKDHPLCLDLFSDLDDLDVVADADTGILPGKIVNPYLALVPVLDQGPPDLGHGPALSLDRDQVAGRDLQGEHGLGIQPGLSAALIAGVRGIHP